jgi:ElaB/YqjD/DUF883 family membrane-anchored ribosome-binding protein
MAKSDAMYDALKPAQSVTEDLKELGSRASEMAQEKLERVKAGAAEWAEEGRERVEEMGESVEQYIADHPVKSMLIAAGIGLIVGRVLLR